MAKIFTKLHLADIVATSGGKSFRKLSTEEPVVINPNTLEGVWQFNNTLPYSDDTTDFWMIDATMSADGYSVTTPCTMGGYNYDTLIVNFFVFTNTALLRFPTYGSGSSMSGWSGFRYYAGDYTGSDVNNAGWYYCKSTNSSTMQVIPCSPPFIEITSKLDEVDKGDRLLAYLQTNATKVG